MIVPTPLQVAKLLLVVTIRLFVAGFKITGYVLVATYNVGWYAAHGRKDKIGDVIGRFGQATVDAVAEVFTFK